VEASAEVAKTASEELAGELEAIEKKDAELEARMKVNPADEKTKKIVDKKNRLLITATKRAASAVASAQPPYLEVKGRKRTV